MSRRTQRRARSLPPFAYRTITFFGRPFQVRSTRGEVFDFLALLGQARRALQPSDGIGSQSTKPPEFGLFPVRSPLLGESRLISIPRGT